MSEPTKSAPKEVVTRTRIVSDEGAVAWILAAERGGPVVTILGGVHGDEDIGVLAVRILRRELTAALEAGTVRMLAPANPSAHSAYRRESPIDGVNLARVFPGDPSGSLTERVAHFVTSRMISGSDLLIDLHSASGLTMMPVFCGFNGRSRTAERSGMAAAAFGAPITWEHTSPLPPGRSLSVAEDYGIPSVYVESEGGGQILASSLDTYVAGTKRVLATLGLIPREAAPPPPSAMSLWIRGEGGDTDDCLTSPCSGSWVAHAGVGESVRAGDLLGVVYSDISEPTAEIRADTDGIVMLLRRMTRVRRGDAIAMIASGEVLEQNAARP